MKDLTQKFLTEADRIKIQTAVQEAEKQTAGEIVPFVVSASYHYPMASVIGAVVLAFPTAVLLTTIVGTRLWIGGQNIWLFLGIFTLSFLVFHPTVQHWPGLKRLFVSRREMDEEVEEAAVTHFFRHGLYRTRDETGVLVFISVFERRVWVLADRGINARARDGQWDEPVRMIVEGIRQHRQADAICDAVKTIGAVLSEHFPVKPDDDDELDNLIVEP